MRDELRKSGAGISGRGNGGQGVHHRRDEGRLILYGAQNLSSSNFSSQYFIPAERWKQLCQAENTIFTSLVKTFFHQ